MLEAGLEAKCLALLCDQLDALLALQVTTPGAARGALMDPACGCLHTRAGEAIFPLAAAYQRTAQARYRQAALALGDWLIAQQTGDGSWLETPEDWRGTTADQLLALCGAMELLGGELGVARSERWHHAARSAADFLLGFIGPETVHVNYLATTAAALAAVSLRSADPRHARRARELARLICSTLINQDGLIAGEGHREQARLYGVDPGYNLDMTLWGLALYARLLGDSAVEEAAARSLAAHLPFLYPDGLLDNSWGTRSYKWTTYGSLTAHGVQASLALLAHRDARFQTGLERTLTYLAGMVRGGLVGYGPRFWGRRQAPCIYPTFTRAAALALVLVYGRAAGPGAPLPCDAPFARGYPSVGVAVVRTGELMATLSAYGYTAPGARARSKYMARSSGGGIHALWFTGLGLVQAAGPARYQRWEEMHLPAAEALLPLGPRVDQVEGSRRYSSLHEFDGSLQLHHEHGAPCVTSCGVVRDLHGCAGGVGYEWRHRFDARSVHKQLVLQIPRGASVRIIEPILWTAGMDVDRAGPRAARFKSPRGVLRVQLDGGGAELQLGEESERYAWPVPALTGYPVQLRIRGSGEQRVSYRIALEQDSGGPAGSVKR